MTFKPDDWPRVKAVFDGALGVERSERTAYVADACAGDSDLRQQVEELLVEHDRTRGLLDVASALGGILRDSEPLHDARGRTVGPFRLIERIGEGGMGIVYRAERADAGFMQRVAIKLIHATVHSGETLRRFRAERQILATLNHPHIVTLLDGGVTDEGQPYIVMECVDGIPVTGYCSERALGLADRLRLFQQVCGAVQDAHQHGIVHRDLKPGNILVTADGIPKILDFGVAKLLDHSGVTDATATGLLRPLTPNYASPEQVRGLPVTTASDIYALGVLLYELLTGTRPYDTSRKTVDEILRIVGEDEPVRPSASRGSGEVPLPYDTRRLRGDLDAIVLKAMSKDPARRYASAHELSEDLSRHLGGRPVIAREPSFGYVALTLLRRHRAGFAAAAVSIVALLGAFGVSLWQTRTALRERNRATERFNDVRQLANALIFKIHDQVQPLAGSTPVRQSIVAEALTYLEHLSRDPAGDDALRLELAKAYHRIGRVQGLISEPNLGDRAGALKSLGSAIDLLRPMTTRPALAREPALEFGRAQLTFATIVNVTGRRDLARAATGEATSTAEALVRRDPSDAEARRLVGSALFQSALLTDDPDSLPIWHRAREVFDALLAEQPTDSDRQRNAALVQKYIGAFYDRQRDYAKSLSHYERALELDGRRLTANPSDRRAQFDVAVDYSNVAHNEFRTGHLLPAAASYERAVEMRTKLADSDPNDVLARDRLAYVHSRLALVYGDLGRSREALDHARRAVEIAERIAHLDPLHVADNLQNLGRIQEKAGERDAACQTFRRARDVAAKMVQNNPSGDPEFGRYLTESIAAGLAACEARSRRSQTVRRR